jgi:hypothetical protein
MLRVESPAAPRVRNHGMCRWRDLKAPFSPWGGGRRRRLRSLDHPLACSERQEGLLSGPLTASSRSRWPSPMSHWPCHAGPNLAQEPAAPTCAILCHLCRAQSRKGKHVKRRFVPGASCQPRQHQRSGHWAGQPCISVCCRPGRQTVNLDGFPALPMAWAAADCRGLQVAAWSGGGRHWRVEHEEQKKQRSVEYRDRGSPGPGDFLIYFVEKVWWITFPDVGRGCGTRPPSPCHHLPVGHLNPGWRRLPMRNIHGCRHTGGFMGTNVT